MSWPPELLRTAPRIGLGLAALGRPAYITTDRQAELGPDRSVESLRQRTDEVLDAAYEAGVCYIDVARSYGLAENFLAGWLQRRGLTAAEIVVGSKWGYTYVGSWRMFDAVQTTWNLLEPSSADALAKAHAAGITVIVKEALANGRLTGKWFRVALLMYLLVLS
jgi:aryl-alcohol dehydrogenase-like predicted oxidoreductase